MTIPGKRLEGATVVFLSGLVALCLAVGSTFWYGLPEPSHQDEYSYLLAADTFSRGRLASPTPAHWQHFERFHVLLQPSYASKYPPAQGLVLALGQVLGHPILGVWLSIACLAAATAWLILALDSPAAALVGGLIAAFRFGLPNYWALSYWGGAVAAVGGALVFGAVVRLLKERRNLRSRAPGIWLGLGLVILASSRPLEGFVFSGCCFLLLAVHLVRRERPGRRQMARRLVPALLVLAAGAFWLSEYNRAVTGSPFELPYMAYEKQYSVVPQLVWMEPAEIESYRHPIFEKFHRTVLARRQLWDSMSALVTENLRRLTLSWKFFVGWVLSIPLLLSSFGRHRNWVGFVLGTSGILALLIFGYQGFHPHYVAVLTAPLSFLFVAGLRVAWSRLPLGRRWMAWGVAAVLLLVAAERIWVYQDPLLGQSRASRIQYLLEEGLRERGGKHLVLVRHGPGASVHDEWIRNSAEIEAQDIIWAHDMGPANGPLMRYYADRTVWRLEVGFDQREPELSRVRDPLSP